jgi:hypothetical protein
MQKRTHSLFWLTICSLIAACGGRVDDVQTPSTRSTPPSITTSTTSQQSPAPAEQPAAENTEAAAPASTTQPDLAQQVAQLRQEVAAIRAQLARGPMANTAAQTREANPRTDPAARQEAERTERMRIASAESAFRGEKQDTRWDQTTTASVRSALTQADENLRQQVRSIECRSQTCRLEINAEAAGALDRDLPMVLSRLGDTLPKITAGQIDQGNGRMATVLYLSK